MLPATPSAVYVIRTGIRASFRALLYVFGPADSLWPASRIQPSWSAAGSKATESLWSYGQREGLGLLFTHMAKHQQGSVIICMYPYNDLEGTL